MRGGEREGEKQAEEEREGRGMRREDVHKHSNYLGNSYEARSSQIFCAIAAVGTQPLCIAAAPSRCTKHQRQASPLCLAWEGPCGCFPGGWEQGSPVPAHSRAPGQGHTLLGLVSQRSCFPLLSGAVVVQPSDWQPVKQARPS